MTTKTIILIIFTPPSLIWLFSMENKFDTKLQMALEKRWRWKIRRNLAKRNQGYYSFRFNCSPCIFLFLFSCMDLLSSKMITVIFLIEVLCYRLNMLNQPKSCQKVVYTMEPMAWDTRQPQVSWTPTAQHWPKAWDKPEESACSLVLVLNASKSE